MLNDPGLRGRALRLTAMILVASAVVYLGSGRCLDAKEVETKIDSSRGHIIIDFSDYTGGSVENWLRTRRFKFEKDAKNRALLGLSVSDQRLELTAKGRLTGFILNDSINFSNVGKVRIDWGVGRYPLEASYEKKVNNEALMIYIFFGTEKVSSGHLFIPDSPHFIGLFLCQDERVNVPYKGRYFHAGGRFVCLGKPVPGQMVASEFDLDHAFKSYFGKHQTPTITGIGLGVDTSKAGDSGRSAAFLKSLEFFKKGGSTATFDPPDTKSRLSLSLLHPSPYASE
jgi:hypothetical protein